MAVTDAKTGKPATEWIMEGKVYANCNCSYGCPCQFSALPTHGDCHAVVACQIETGRWGDAKLDGLRAAGIFTWPGAVHEGNGTMQLIIDQRATTRQREALLRILTGEDTDPMATGWAVYAAMCPNRLEPLFGPIEFEVDISARRARLVVPGVIESTGEPIRNPVTGAEHRVRIDMPNGFDYRLAEIGSGITKTTGALELNMRNSYGQFNEFHFNNHGVFA